MIKLFGTIRKNPTFLLILSVLLLSLLAAGCSGSSPAPGQQTPAKNPPNTQSASPQNSTQIQPTESAPGTLEVHFVDVGQADTELIKLPNGKTMLIDAGNNDDGPAVASYLRQAGVKKIDYLIGTHPHEDHIGGMDTVIKSFDIDKIYMPKVSSNTKTFQDVLRAIQDKGKRVTTAQAGVVILNDKDLSIKILAPVGSKYEDLNNYSAVVKLTYGQTSFLFTGDAEAVSEAQILSGGSNLKADVLKAGHHGSSSSSSLAFLKAVSPKFAVIAVGKGNDYGHPHKETLAKLTGMGVKVYRTDLDGTVVFTSDGNKLSTSK